MKGADLDDESLVVIAKRLWSVDAAGKAPEVAKLIKAVETGNESMTNEGRNLLLHYIRDRQSNGRMISMAQMKKHILEVIGFAGQSDWYSNGNMSRAQIEAVYAFVLKTAPPKKTP